MVWRSWEAHWPAGEFHHDPPRGPGGEAVKVEAVQDFWSALSAQHKAACDALRAMGPVVELDGVYYLTRRDEVLAALSSPEVFSSALRPRHWAFEVVDVPRVPGGCDPPELTHYRKILQPLFGPDAIKELLPALTKHAQELIEAVVSDGECEAIGAIAMPYGLQGLQVFLGLPPEHGGWLTQAKYEILAGTVLQSMTLRSLPLRWGPHPLSREFMPRVTHHDVGQAYLAHR